MPPKFSPVIGAQGFQQSNPSVLALAALLGSLQIFKEVGMIGPIRERSIQLTGALERMLQKSKYFVPVDQVMGRYTNPDVGDPGFTIITPKDPSQRGAQLSLLFFPTGTMRKIFQGLCNYGMIGDERDPDVIRLSPAPLYNILEDCERAALYLEEAFNTMDKSQDKIDV